jgi:hypothetical protein
MQYQNTWTQDLEDGITTLSMTLDLTILILAILMPAKQPLPNRKLLQEHLRMDSHQIQLKAHKKLLLRLAALVKTKLSKQNGVI